MSARATSIASAGVASNVREVRIHSILLLILIAGVQVLTCTVEQENKCPNATFFAYFDTDQGAFGTAMAVDISALWKIPEGISSEDAGPLMCGGATVWQPLVDANLKPGDRVGIIGIGGLGHLAIQFASKLGLEPVVFSSTTAKREQAVAFGATEFHATKNPDELAKIKKLDLLLITTNSNPDLLL